MRLPSNFADLLFGREAYKVSRLLTEREFARLCRDCGVVADSERLLRLERLGIFKPILRTYGPDQLVKVEFLNGGANVHYLGPLEEGEEWRGETISEQLRFDFWKPIVESWREHGLLADARSDGWPHAETLESEAERHEAYYSRFQIWDLDECLTPLTLRVQVEAAFDESGNPTDAFADLPTRLSELALSERKRNQLPRYRDTVGLLCQLISDRYYPHAQSDYRRRTLTRGSHWHDWDWYAFARAWKAGEVAELFDLSNEESRNIYFQLSMEQARGDPIEDWYKLVRFVAVDKRQKLKGDALLSEVLREMAQMLRRFHEDAFCDKLPDPNETTGVIIHRFPDIEPEDDPFAALELIANDFHLNPKPQLVLLVEGDTEETALPILFDRLFAAKPAIYGIEFVNLRGVSTATGSKKDSLSAVWRLVDYLHQRQTITMVLLDREGLAPRNVGKGLVTAPSVHFPDRMATRREYVKLWNRSFEFDNFSDREIAAAMSKLAGQTIARAGVTQCRQMAGQASKGAKAPGLTRLFSETTGRGLDKRELALELIEGMFAPSCRRNPMTRPISRFLLKARDRAALNHQPHTRKVWEYNQRSGYLGTLKPGAVSRRKRPYGDDR